MSEATSRKRVVKALAGLHAVPVENPAQPGTPDVNCSLGWIEQKWLRRWPTRDGTPVLIPHFTTRQRRWLRKRWETDRGAWLLLQVQHEWLLFTGRIAHDYVGRVDRARLRVFAMNHWVSGLKDKELVEALKRSKNGE